MIINKSARFINTHPVLRSSSSFRKARRTMRFLLASGVLFIVFVVTSAIYNPVSFKPRNLVKPSMVKLLDQRRNVIGNAHHFIRQKRQGQACIDAYLEGESPLAEKCTQLLSDGPNVTLDELSTFCGSDGCLSLLTRLFTDLESCEGVDDNRTVSRKLCCMVVRAQKGRLRRTRPARPGKYGVSQAGVWSVTRTVEQAALFRITVS